MENCLVTTLRQAIDNDNLPILDSIVINVVKTEEERLPEQKYLEFRLVENTSVTFTVLDGSNKIALSETFMENNPKNMVTVANPSGIFKIYFVNDNYKVKVSSKNNIQVFRNYIGISATKRTYIEPIYNGMSGLDNLRNFINSSSSLPFNIEILKDATSLVTFMSPYSPNCYGDIASLGDCILLETLRLTGTSCSGNVEELVQKQVDNGRTSGTLQILAANSNIKYNGSSIANYITITFNESGYVIS